MADQLATAGLCVGMLRAYHDSNHYGGSRSHASPQAIYNAIHGTWLWPPAERTGP